MRQKWKHGGIVALAAATALAMAACTKAEVPAPSDSSAPVSAVQEVPSQVEAGGDWRTWRGYSEEYVINENLAVLFSDLDGGNGYAVYDASGGARIGTLLFETYTQDDVAPGDFSLEDIDGDGNNDIGVPMTDGEVLWFVYNPDGHGTWPDNVGGCFSPYTAETD